MKRCSPILIRSEGRRSPLHRAPATTEIAPAPRRSELAPSPCPATVLLASVPAATEAQGPAPCYLHSVPTARQSTETGVSPNFGSTGLEAAIQYSQHLKQERMMLYRKALTLANKDVATQRDFITFEDETPSEVALGPAGARERGTYQTEVKQETTDDN